jgi:hypothetical protein
MSPHLHIKLFKSHKILCFFDEESTPSANEAQNIEEKTAKITKNFSIFP